jgi:hypothetical protein
MTKVQRGHDVTTRLLLTTAAGAIALGCGALPAAAQTQATPAAAAGQRTPGDVSAPAPELPSTPTDNAMSNLVRLLAERGVITKEAGAALIQQAQSEAAQAKVQQAASGAGGDLPAPAAGSIRVPYVPPAVRDQIKQELRTEVMAQAREEGWAAPEKAAAGWTRNLQIYGDARIRSRNVFFDETNSNQIFNFNAINANGPTDVLNTPALPYVNTRQDQYNNLQFRLRLGLDAQITPYLKAGVLLMTGDDNNPAASNFSLGAGFGKRQIWVQRAYIQAMPTSWSSATFGRFDNPFVSTPIVFDEDLQFDGVYGEVRLGDMIDPDIRLNLRGGAFPLDYGDADRISTQQNKQAFPQKYLFSGQIEAGADLGNGVSVTLAAAYHHYANLQGRLSDPCLIYAGATQCSTDDLRPFFLRQGNTLSPLRQIALDPNLPAGEIQPQPQFFGLTFNYHLLDFNALVNVPMGDHRRVQFGGDYVKNIGYKRSDACRYGLLGQPFNNGGNNGDGNVCSTTNPTSLQTGNTAWTVYGAVGAPAIRDWGDWNLQAGYRYIESDATLDAFTDDLFHNGGTNAKGYFLTASLGVTRNLSFATRWLSSNEIKGEHYGVDLLLVDLMAAF